MRGSPASGRAVLAEVPMGLWTLGSPGQGGRTQTARGCRAHRRAEGTLDFACLCSRSGRERRKTRTDQPSLHPRALSPKCDPGLRYT